MTPRMWPAFLLVTVPPAVEGHVCLHCHHLPVTRTNRWSPLSAGSASLCHGPHLLQPKSELKGNSLDFAGRKGELPTSSAATPEMFESGR